MGENKKKFDKSNLNVKFTSNFFLLIVSSFNTVEILKKVLVWNF